VRSKASTNNKLLAILLLALVLRLALWAQPLHEPANDETEYIAVAYDLLAGQGWQFYEQYHWLRAPLYPLFLAASLWLTDGNLHLAALPNIALSVATVWLIFVLSRTLFACSGGNDVLTQRRRDAEGREETATSAHMASATIPLLAALLAALLFTFNTFASLYMSETLFSFLFTAALLIVLKATAASGRSAQRKAQQRERGAVSPFSMLHAPSTLLAVGGILYGLATLTRSVSLAFLPFVVLWIVLASGFAQGFRPTLTRLRSCIPPLRSLAAGFIFFVCVFLPIAPWTIRNCQAYGSCILVETGLSYNLWAFSEPQVTQGEIFRTLEAIPNPAERAEVATQRGLQRLREDPTILLRKPWPNWVTLWRVKPIQDRFLVPDYYTDPPPLVFLGALLLDDALYAIIALASVFGLTHALRHPHTRLPTILLSLWLLYIIGTTMLTHGEGRYRHFLFPVLIPYAALALQRATGKNSSPSMTLMVKSGQEPRIPRITRIDAVVEPLHATALPPKPHGPSESLMGEGFGERVKAKILPLISLALATLLFYTMVSWYPWEWAIGGATRSLYRIPGDIAYALGDVPRAQWFYQQAYQAQKTADGRILLGNVARDMGDLAQAEEHYRSAWSRKRRYAGANASLGNLLRERGAYEEARDAFEGYFVAEQYVTDWSWRNLHPQPTDAIDIGNELDFGYVGGVYNAEVQQNATARWTNGTGKLRLSSLPDSPAQSLIIHLRMAAPHPDKNSDGKVRAGNTNTTNTTNRCAGRAIACNNSTTKVVHARICSQDVCQPVVLPPTWRVVSLLLPSAAGQHTQVIEIDSPTFHAPDGREPGVLLDWAKVEEVGTGDE
jgi:4-amino-4-deoxy-L-arabinose transferase-like glycosyltransferase